MIRLFSERRVWPRSSQGARRTVLAVLTKGWELRECWPATPLPGNQKVCYADRTLTLLCMSKKPTTKRFHLDAIVAGRIISGDVAFSPAPEPGILTELARFEAERLLEHMVKEEIASGSL
jgi:hypothetical protein